MLSLRPVPLFLSAALVCGSTAVCSSVWAGQPKIDKETCEQLKTEQARFMESGIVGDLQKGPEWGKANLTAERLREIEHFILLDEQLKFGCRQVTLTGDILRAGEAASRIEVNPNPVEEPAPGAGATMSGEGAATPPGQTVREKAPKPAKPKSADAYQPPARPSRPVAPESDSAQRAAGSQ